MLWTWLGYVPLSVVGTLLRPKVTVKDSWGHYSPGRTGLSVCSGIFSRGCVFNEGRSREVELVQPTTSSWLLSPSLEPASGESVAREAFDFRPRIFPVMEKVGIVFKQGKAFGRALAPPVPGSPGPSASLTDVALVRERGVERRFSWMGRSIFLGFNEIIYCLFALTKIVNVMGEI